MNDKITNAVQQLAGTFLADNVHLVTATVTSVDEASRTCAANTIGGKASTDIQDIQLMAEVQDGVYYLPSVGSTIIVSYSTRNAPFVVLFSKIDKIVSVVGTTEKTQDDETIVNTVGNTIATINSSGFSFKTANEDFTKFMTDLLTFLAEMTFTNGAGTTAVANNINAPNGLADLQQRLPNILIEL
jgi:hypothetical protein